MRSQRLITANRQFLTKLATEAGAGENPAGDGEAARPPVPPDDDYFEEVEDPDQLVGATAIARWRFRLVDVTDADRKRIYYEAKTRGEEAGYGIIPKNRITLSKSKYRAFKAREGRGGQP